MASQSQNVGNIGGASGTMTLASIPSSSTSTSSSLLSPSSTAPNVQLFNTQQQQHHHQHQHQQQQHQHQHQQQQMQHKSGNNFEPIDKSSSNTLKRNPKMELSKTDLLKLLGYLEGELQARDIVIAALKSEKMKHLLNSRYRSGTNDPHAALTRDVAIVGGVIRMECSQADRQVASLETLVTQQRRTQCRMAKVLKEAEMRHRTVIKELEEEKRKHEHDTAQGDDITYGLEKERTRLKKELELERQEKKRLENELKKENIAMEIEKNRQKQIVLLLLAERKKIIMKYIEERKRSEDLAQILSEEKVRIDTMAEGLEEESKKSLQMEAELEKQIAQFDIERQQYRQALLKEEKKNKELEIDIEKIKIELESWKSGVTMRGTVRSATVGGGIPPPPPAKPANLSSITTLRPTGTSPGLKGQAVLGTGTPMVSSKVVQPTATVSSVPVSGPTTGIARSVTPRQAMRGVTYGTAVAPTPIATVATAATATTTATTAATPTPVTIAATTVSNDNGTVTPATTTTTTTTTTTVTSNTGTTVTTSVADNTNTTVTEPQTTSSSSLLSSTTTTAITAATVSSSSSLSLSSTTTTTTSSSVFGQTIAAVTAVVTAKKPIISRGIPPPVPPNKPIVPPKKEGTVYMRRQDPNQQIQDVKQIKTPLIPACQTNVVNQNQQVQAITTVTSHQTIEEVKPR